MSDLENKHVASLDFKIEKATQQLKDLTKTVNEFSSDTETKFQNVGTAIEKSLKDVNISGALKDFANQTKNIDLFDVNQTRKRLLQLAKEYNLTGKQVANEEKKIFNLEMELSGEATKTVIKNKQKEYDTNLKILAAEEKAQIEVNKKSQILQEKESLRKQRQAEKEQKQIQNSFGNTVKQFAGATLGITSAYEAFYLLKKAISDTIEDMKNVEYRMMEISRIMEDGSIVVNEYRDDLITLAKEYGRSFDDVSTATLNFARAGFNAQESLKLTEQAMLALNTAELDSEEATDGLIAVMAQWGLNTGDAAEEAESLGAIIDKINKTADNFPIESKDILEALQRVSQGFALSGATIDETIAMIVAAEKEAQRGGKVIGTAMANMVQQLKSEGKLNLAEQLGLDFYKDDAQTEFKSVTEIFATMSERMKELKEAGKESSVEMQQLLELFTVFRRNIGAGLLSEMGGEDSTYLQALKTSQESLGYSLQENSKYMDTMTAKSEQLESQLLDLKTKVWDGGLKDVASGAITLASQIIDKIVTLSEKVENFDNILTKLITKLTGSEKKAKDVVSVLYGASTPFTGLLGILGSVNNALEAMSTEEENAVNKAKEFKTASKNLDSLAKSYKETIDSYQELSKKGESTANEEEKLYDIEKQVNEILKESGKSVEIINKNVDKQGNIVNEVNSKYKEQLELIRSISTENSKKSIQELSNAVKEAEAMRGYTFDYKDKLRLKFTSLIDDSEIKKFNSLNFEQQTEYLQKWITQLENAASTGKNVSDAMGLLQDALSTLEQQQEAVTTATKNYKDALNELYSEGLFTSINNYNEALTQVQNNFQNGNLEKYINGVKELNNQYINGSINAQNYFSNLSESIKNIDLQGTGKTITRNTEAIENNRISLKETNDALIEIAQNQDILSKATEEGTEKFFKNSEGLKDIGTNFKNISGEIIESNEKIQESQAIFASTTQSVAEAIEIIQGQFDAGQITFQEYANSMEGAAQSTLDLYTQSNELTLENEKWVDAAGNVDSYANSLQNAVSNLESFNGILSTIDENQQFLSEHLNDFGQLALENTDLSSQAYQNFANSFINDLNVMREANASIFQDIVGTAEQAAGVTAGAFIDANGNIVSSIAGDAKAMNALVNASTTSVGKALGELTTSAGNVITALGNVIKNFDYTINFIPSGSLHFDKINLLDAIKNGGDINFSGEGLHLNITGEGGGNVGDLGSALADFGGKLSNISPVVTNLGDILAAGRPRNVGGTGRDYKAPYTPTVTSPSGTGGSSGYSSSTTEKNTILQDFKDAISERESEEQRWVKKQKELNQLSLDDQKYILQQEIERYKKYADEVMRLNGVTEEEKLKVRKEYLQKAEDLELDYFELLEDQLNEQIKAIQEKYDERIDKINEAADAEIEALKKVEDENDRIREKEEYQRRRDEIIHGHQGIEYWEQRTGREAQLALAEARKELEDLDRDWAEKQESWTTEDQIAAIEARRDADIEAAQQQMDAEIAAIQATYDYRVKLFAETGQIIYDEAVLQSKALYDTYKKNFIDPVGSELQKALSQQASTNTVSNSTRDYVIQWGDTLTGIANRFGTTIQKLMQANPFIVDPNRIYAGQTLKIPQAHTGKKVLKDGMVELQAGEVVLNTKWARDLDRMLSNYSNNTNNNTVNNNGNTVNVRGDMMKIEATIEDKSDVNTLARKIKKTIESQFSIR